MPGSRPDQVGMPEVWLMIELHDNFYMYFGPASPVVCNHCFQMVLIVHLPYVLSCCGARFVGHELLLTSFFSGYNPICLKLYCCSSYRRTVFGSDNI